MKTLLSIFASLLFSLNAFAVSAQSADPDALVKSTADEVIEILKKDKDIQSGDLSKVTELAEAKILPHFDFERMSRMVLGKHWSKASAEQKQQFIVEFRSLLVRTYASALTKFRNQTIEYKPTHIQDGATTVTVRTQVLQPGGQPLPIDYALVRKNDSWKVYDVAIEGISLVTNYRGQFSGEIRQSGIDGLIQKLAEKNRQL